MPRPLDDLPELAVAVWCLAEMGADMTGLIFFRNLDLHAQLAGELQGGRLNPRGAGPASGLPLPVHSQRTLDSDGVEEVAAVSFVGLITYQSAVDQEPGRLICDEVGNQQDVGYTFSSWTITWNAAMSVPGPNNPPRFGRPD